MAQISIPDALYQRLQVTAHQQGVSLDTIVQEALENVSATTFLSVQEEQRLFDMLDQLAQQNGHISPPDWGTLVSELRD